MDIEIIKQDVSCCQSDLNTTISTFHDNNESLGDIKGFLANVKSDIHLNIVKTEDQLNK